MKLSMNFLKARENSFVENSFYLFTKPKKFFLFFLLTGMGFTLNTLEILNMDKNAFFAGSIALSFVLFGAFSFVLYETYTKNRKKHPSVKEEKILALIFDLEQKNSGKLKVKWNAKSFAMVIVFMLWISALIALSVFGFLFWIMFFVKIAVSAVSFLISLFLLPL